MQIFWVSSCEKKKIRFCCEHAHFHTQNSSSQGMNPHTILTPAQLERITLEFCIDSTTTFKPVGECWVRFSRPRKRYTHTNTTRTRTLHTQQPPRPLTSFSAAAQQVGSFLTRSAQSSTSSLETTRTSTMRTARKSSRRRSSPLQCRMSSTRRTRKCSVSKFSEVQKVYLNSDVSSWFEFESVGGESVFSTTFIDASWALVATQSQTCRKIRTQVKAPKLTHRFSFALFSPREPLDGRRQVDHSQGLDNVWSCLRGPAQSFYDAWRRVRERIQIAAEGLRR